MNPIIKLLEDYISSSGSTWVCITTLKSIALRRKISLNNLDPLVVDGILSVKKIDKTIYYTFFSMDKMESLAAYHAVRILNKYSIYHPEVYTDDEIDKYLEIAKKETGITLHEQQRAAVIAGINHGMSVITGGPGTGKTCTLTTLVYVLRLINPLIDVHFTSPTGKASRRITESTKEPAKTVQKELGITPDNPDRHMFRGDILVVDEVSMLDLETALQVFQAVADGKKLILVGDINQLPSVGPGAVLRDLIFSNIIPTVMLTKTYRQANDSNLFGNIMRIKDGQWKLSSGDDFDVVTISPDPTSQLIELFLREVSLWGIDHVACLLPYRRKGMLCSNRINGILQEKVNPVTVDKPYIWVEKYEDSICRKVCFNVDDPVMQLDNRTECANGDVGKVIRIGKGFLEVQYIDCIVRYSISEAAKQLELAYAMSINKSQGSEYKSVVMAITSEHKQMLKRNLVYTGVTRAKVKCTLLYEQEALKKAIETQDEYDRITFLAEKIRFYQKKYIYEHVA